MGILESVFSQLPTLCSLAVGAVLLLSGFSKLLDAADFARVLGGFRALPPRAVKPIAVFIPAIELVVGGWLALGSHGTNAAAVVAGGLFIVFAIMIARTLLRGGSIECGCFGRIFGERKTSWLTVGRNAFLAAMAMVAALGYVAGSGRFVTGLPALLVITATALGAILAAEVSSAFCTGLTHRRAVPESAQARPDPRTQS